MFEKKRSKYEEGYDKGFEVGFRRGSTEGIVMAYHIAKALTKGDPGNPIWADAFKGIEGILADIRLFETKYPGISSEQLVNRVLAESEYMYLRPSKAGDEEKP